MDHKHCLWYMRGFPGGSDGKESACNAGGLNLIPESGRSCCYFCFSLKLPSKQLYWKIPTLPWMNQEEKPSVHTQTSPVQPGRAEAPGAALGTSLQLQRQPERGGIWTAAASGVGSGGAARGP